MTRSRTPPRRGRSRLRARRASTGTRGARPPDRSLPRSPRPPAGARRRPAGRASGSRCTCPACRPAAHTRPRRRTVPRLCPSSSETICIARTFGAPETVPAGKHARRRSNGVTPSRSSPVTSETRCVTCEKRSGSRKRATWTVPARQTRERSFRPRSTSMTCSARSFSDASRRSASPSPGSVVPAIGLRLACPALALDEGLGRAADEREPVELEQEEVGRGVDAPERAVEVERRGRRWPLRPLREDDLVRVAAADVLLHPPYARLVRRAVRRAPHAAVGRGGDFVFLEHKLARERPRRRIDVSLEHGRRAAAVVVPDEGVGDDEAARRDVRAVRRERHLGLERRDVVVGEVADHRPAEPLGLLERDDPRAGADERVAPEATLLDRLEQEARVPLLP